MASSLPKSLGVRLLVVSTVMCAGLAFAQNNSYSNSDECRVIVEQQAAAWDKAYAEHMHCWAKNKCQNPAGDQRLNIWARQRHQLRDDCNRMALIERTNKQAAFEASRHTEQPQQSSQAQRTRIVQDPAYFQRQAQNTQNEKQASQKATAGALLDIFNTVISSKSASAEATERESAAVERYQAQQEQAERIHKEAQRNQSAAINKIQNEQWKRVKEQNTKTIVQIDALGKTMDSIKGDDNPWAAGTVSARPSGSAARGAVFATNPWGESARPPMPLAEPRNQVALAGNGTPGEQNPWTEPERLAGNDASSLLNTPLAPGMVFYRDVDSGSLRAMSRTEVKSARGDTAKSCSIDGVGIVLARCESQRRKKRAG